jgi:thiamine-phosphate pyrophosphorylase
MNARHHSWPRIWLMTDERMGNRLWEALERLPEGAGIVFRHYSLPREAREGLAAKLAETAHRRGLALAIAGDGELARRVGAKLVHNPAGNPGLPFSVPVHSAQEAEAARSAGAELVFVSPVYATRSHPGREPLGAQRAAEIARAAAVTAIALGGMDAQKFALLDREAFYGWAAIDAWLRT